MMALLEKLLHHRDQSRGLTRLQSQQKLMVFDAVLETKNAALQADFVQRTVSWFLSDEALLLTLICESEPEAFLGILGGQGRGSWLRSLYEESTVRAVIERLKSLHEGPDASIAAKAVAAFAGCIRGKSISNLRENSAAIVGLAGPMLDASFTAGASDDRTAAGIELLTALPGLVDGSGYEDEQQWLEKLAGISRAFTAGAKFAAAERHTPAVARLVLAVHRYHLLSKAKDPALADAVEAAGRTIIANGKPADQVQALCGGAWSDKPELYKPAVEELGKRLIAGTVPADLRVSVLEAIRVHPEPVCAELAQFLLARITDAAAEPREREQALRALNRDGKQFPLILDALEPLTKADRNFAMASQFAMMVRNALYYPRRREETDPAWTERAAELGLTIVTDTARPLSARAGGIELYAYGAGAKAAPKLEAFIADGKLEPELRAAAAEKILEANPETRIFASMAKQYGDLPKQLREALALTARWAKRADGAEAFLICYLNDKTPGLDRARVLWSIRLPRTPMLEAGLKELENDPQLGSQVKGAIQRLENANRNQR